MGWIQKALTLGVTFVRHRQTLTAAGAACSQYATAVCRCHALAEPVLVHALALRRLKCAFHRVVFFVDPTALTGIRAANIVRILKSQGLYL